MPVAPRLARAAAVLSAALLATTALATGPTYAAAGEVPGASSSDAEVGVSGAPFTGTTAAGELRGLVDAHSHPFSDDGFGGGVVCGATYSEAGIADALRDCPSHYPDGSAALLENATKGSALDAKHDPVGYPTFRDWPAHDSLTHQQMYYQWVERAWRGGQRVLVADLVSNSAFCQLFSSRQTSCDDMVNIRRQARTAYGLQDYVDRLAGGAGRGWFRIVTSAAQARSVIEQGKLAVVLGVETSEPFGCKQILGVAQCDRADIDAGLDELHGLGVRSMFLCHKFDNALCGVRFDEGTQGIFVNAGQFLTTGTWWQTQQCTGPWRDHTIATGVLPPALAAIFPVQLVFPVYPTGPHCNPKGLSELGEYALTGMMSRGMMLELDHMSVKAADRALDLLERANYPGVLSTHSWVDELYLERIFRLGGFVTQYGHDTAPFLAEYARTKPLLDSYERGYGFGMDMNGFGGTPAPPAAPRVTYPFTSFDGGSTLTRQTTGQRTWDYNTDGVAHYGQVPDWVEDLRLSGGAGLIADLARGAESYTDTFGATQSWSPPANLALNRPAGASSTEWSLLTNYAPGRAVDGSLATRWASAWSDAQWWRVDLGAARTVGRVAIDWEAAYARSYRIETATDGTTWTTAATVRAGQGGTEVTAFAPRPARHVRLVFTSRATSYGYSMREVSVQAR